MPPSPRRLRYSVQGSPGTSGTHCAHAWEMRCAFSAHCLRCWVSRSAVAAMTCRASSVRFSRVIVARSAALHVSLKPCR